MLDARHAFTAGGDQGRNHGQHSYRADDRISPQELVGARKHRCRADPGQPARHVHCSEVTACPAKLWIRNHVGDHTRIGGARCVGEELDPQVPDEQLRVAVGGHHDAQADEVEDRAAEDDRPAPSPWGVQVVRQLPHQRRNTDREDGADSNHSPQRRAKNVVRD